MIALVMSSCSMKDKGDSRVILNLPSASALSSRVGAFSYSWDRACFAMNITAPDINSPEDATCEVHRGIFAGTAAPNSELSASVPRGDLRKLELFAYFRNSSAEPCPALNGGFGTLDRKKIVRVGVVESFEVANSEVNLTVNVSLPATGTSVVSQYSMPNSCVASATGTTSGRLVSAAESATGTNSFAIRHRVSYKVEDSAQTSASGYQIKGTLNNEGP
jgi:hypothetical protein